MKHAITSVRLIPPDGFTWACACGNSGVGPRPVAAQVLAKHLEEEE